MKPDDIPQGVWDDAKFTWNSANEASYSNPKDAVTIIARAIMAEREACIQVVKDHPHFEVLSDDEAAKHGVMARQTGRQDIIDAIRSRP